MKYLSLLSLTAFILFSCQSPQPPEEKVLTEAEQILAKTLDFHDPENKWGSFASSVEMQSYIPSRSPQDKRVTIVVMDNAKSSFTSQTLRDGYAFTRKVRGENDCSSSWAKPELTPADSSSYAISCEAAKSSRDYYRYLLGLPMVLTDTATHLSDSVFTEIVAGKTCDILTVDYLPQGSHPTWQFYVDQESGQLLQTRFFTYYPEEDTTRGEIIKLGDLVEFDGMKKFGNFEWQYLDSSFLASESFLFEPI